MTFARSDLERRIRTALDGIGGAPLREGMTRLLAVLGYRSDRVPMLEGVSSLLELGRDLTEKQCGLLKSMSETCALFQFTTDEIPITHRGFRRGGTWSYPESLLFLAAELTPWDYSPWDLAYMTRVVNRIFAIPVIVMYRYRRRTGERPVLAVAVVHHRAHRRDAGRDVLEHVAFAKDIKFDNPSPVDLEILAGLSLDRWIRMRTRG